MKKKSDKKYIGEAGFWGKWFSKLLFTLISVKVWGLVAGTWISTYLLLNTEGASLTGGQWLTFNTTIWALIFGMKEIFRISEKRDKVEQEQLTEQIESKVKISAIMSQSKQVSSNKQSSFTPDGLEIVGDEPEA